MKPEPARVGHRGNAVQFGGRNIAVDVSGLPSVNGWFTNNTASGSAFAILDEAQYNTLLFAEAGQGAGNAANQSEARDIIVGTPNNVLGKTVTLSQADANSNGIVVDGNDIVLGHDQFYAVVDGDGVTVIKGGAVRNWQEAAPELGLDVELPFQVDLFQHEERPLASIVYLSARLKQQRHRVYRTVTHIGELQAI